MRIAVLATGTPAEVQRALALTEELARREQLRVRACFGQGQSSLDLETQGAELTSFLCDTDASRPWPTAPIAPEAAEFALHILESRAPSDVLELAQDGSWFQWRERYVDLSARRVLARILATLVRAQRERPGELIRLDDFIAAAWPSEQMQRKSAHNRVRVALSTLRSFGLRELLISRAGGIMLDPRVEIASVTS